MMSDDGRELRSRPGCPAAWGVRGHGFRAWRAEGHGGSRARMVLALIALMPGLSCSLPVGGGGRFATCGYAITSPDSRSVVTMVPGLDVRVGTANDGLNVG